MKTVIATALLALAFFSAGALAVEDDQIRGEVVSVDPDAATIQVRVTESGDERSARIGSVHTFSVSEDTRIEYEIDRTLYAPFNDTKLSDISEGDTVLLDFEDRMGNRQAKNVRNERTSNTAVQDRIRRDGQVATAPADMQRNDTTNMAAAERSRLPDSASILPLLAVLGLLFAGLGAAVRRVRS